MTVTKEPQGNGNDHYMQGYEEGVRDTKEFWVKKNQKDAIDRARDYQKFKPQVLKECATCLLINGKHGHNCPASENNQGEANE